MECSTVCLSQILDGVVILTPEIKWQAFRSKDNSSLGLLGSWSCLKDRKVQYQK